MNITDEAVEVAARSMVAALESGYIDAEDMADVLIDVGGFDLVAAMRTVLEAAAPHMMAEFWDAGYAAGAREEQPGWTKNPYRTAK